MCLGWRAQTERGCGRRAASAVERQQTTQNPAGSRCWRCDIGTGRPALGGDTVLNYWVQTGLDEEGYLSPGRDAHSLPVEVDGIHFPHPAGSPAAQHRKPCARYTQGCLSEQCRAPPVPQAAQLFSSDAPQGAPLPRAIPASPAPGSGRRSLGTARP